MRIELVFKKGKSCDWLPGFLHYIHETRVGLYNLGFSGVEVRHDLDFFHQKYVFSCPDGQEISSNIVSKFLAFFHKPSFRGVKDHSLQINQRFFREKMYSFITLQGFLDSQVYSKIGLRSKFNQYSFDWFQKYTHQLLDAFYSWYFVRDNYCITVRGASEKVVDEIYRAVDTMFTPRTFTHRDCLPYFDEDSLEVPDFESKFMDFLGTLIPPMQEGFDRKSEDSSVFHQGKLTVFSKHFKIWWLCVPKSNKNLTTLLFLKYFILRKIKSVLKSEFDLLKLGEYLKVYVQDNVCFFYFFKPLELLEESKTPGTVGDFLKVPDIGLNSLDVKALFSKFKRGNSLDQMHTKSFIESSFCSVEDLGYLSLVAPEFSIQNLLDIKPKQAKELNVEGLRFFEIKG